jgi:NAD(P)-dependent dehydrogenase (short-subunit alcohol dehydrogenase family)
MVELKYGTNNYAASKAGIFRFYQICCALELGSHVFVVMQSLGFIETENDG